MSIPSQNEIYRPLLNYLSEESGFVKLSVITGELAKRFGVTDEERRKERFETSGRRRFDIYIAFAVNTLKQSGLIESEPSRRGYYRIKEEGKKKLRERTPGKNKQTEETINRYQNESPYDAILEAIEKLNNVLEKEILDRLRSPNFDSDDFEQLAIDLLVSMGYGKSGEKTKRSRDGGIDGIVNEDILGLSQIGIQAKCYNEKNKVVSGDIDKFSGALGKDGFQKGCFITTSYFTDAAKATAKKYNEKETRNIKLIDGDELAKLMREHNMGCRDAENYNTKELDESFWQEREQVKEEGVEET